MISYALLPMPFKTLLVTSLFLSMCAGVCTCFIVGKKQGTLRHLLLILGTVALSAIMLLYASLIRAERAQPHIPAISIWFANLPLLVTLPCFAAILCLYVIVIRAEWARRKTEITLSSIKESLDHLQTGLCFSRSNGLILLTNHRMNELSHALFGQHLQSANLFWASLCSETPLPTVTRLTSGDQPEFCLKDGSIWSFKRETLESVVQITAADITKQHELLTALQARNQELEAMNARIRRYGDEVDEYVIARERLETRVNLHSFLGQSLLMTRHALQYKTGDRKKILEIWQRNIDVLRLEAEPQQEPDSLASLQNAAQAIGMHVHVTGSLPACAQMRKLIASIGAETLTNAVRHAGATQLYIHAETSDTAYTIRYTNDGAVPSAPITEGGGLGTARKKVEAAGGTMLIESAPRFALTLSFHKEVTTHV